MKDKESNHCFVQVSHDRVISFTELIARQFK